MVQLTPHTQTSSPVAAINATRPPALMVIAGLPTCPISEARKDLSCVFAARQKMGIFGQHRAKSRQHDSCACASPVPIISGSVDPVRSDAIDVMSQSCSPTRQPADSPRAERLFLRDRQP